MLAPLLAVLLSAADSPTSLALYPLQGRGLDAVTLATLDGALRQQIEAMGRFQLMGRGETESVLAPPGVSLGVRCESGKVDCLAGVGRLLNAAVTCFGVLTPQATELLLIDSKSSAEVRRVRISGPPPDALREAAIALFTPDRYVGKVFVIGNQGRVAIDGIERGDLPLPSPIVIEVGRHIVTVTIPGGSSVDLSADVRFGETCSVDGRPGATLAPVIPVAPRSEGPRRPREGLSASQVMATAGLTVAILAGAAGIVCGAIAQDNVDAANGTSRPVAVSDRPLLDQRLQRAQSFGLAADVLWGSAAALGLASVVLYLVAPNSRASAGGDSANLEVNNAGALVRF